MKPHQLFGGLILAALMTYASANGASDDKHNPNGEPAGFKAGLPASYAVWHHNHRWQLRTTTAKKLHHFRGYIKVEGGHLDRVHSHHLEKSGKCEDHWRLSSDRKELHFDFKTDKGIDGINFHVSKGAKHLKLNLHIDGKHQHRRIWLGHGKHHPIHDPFTVAAHPGK